MATMDPPQAHVPLTDERIERLQEMIGDELDAAWLYDRLAGMSDREPAHHQPAEVLRNMAESEREHAAHWIALLGDHEPQAYLDLHRPSLRVRLMAFEARVFGLGYIISQLRREELFDIQRYVSDPDSGGLAEEEREHRATLAELAPQFGAEGAIGEGHAGVGAQGASTFRAALFGLNDGIVSNLALIAGVAGVAIGSDAVLVAGFGGWLAGAFSMAGGEYISVRSQSEVLQRQIAMERDEVLLDPGEERRELISIYRSKGLSQELAEQVAAELSEQPDALVDTMVREELGLDPDGLGNPWKAAASSFLSFSFGALIPLLPFLVWHAADWTVNYWALIVGVLASVVTLAVAGLFTSLVTSRSPLYAAGRSVLVGVLFAAITFAIGSALPFDL
ncbi:MAG: rubrerythrin family protein [Chloroflexi bacterium]|nr:rubrerythrin family protein [Chloroflexota bacterium]